MFGATLRDHEARYEYAQEWLDIVRLAWSPRDDFDFDGQFFNLKGVRAKPKPYGGTRPLMMNAGASRPAKPSPSATAMRFFQTYRAASRSSRPAATSAACMRWHDKPAARSMSLRLGSSPAGPTAREAQDYYRHAVVDNADWPAVDNILAMKNITPQTHSPEEFQRIRDHQANGMGGLPLVGDPDSVARDMTRLAESGLRGIAVSFVNYLDELPYFCAEVLPRLARAGLRDSRKAGRVD